MSVRVYAEAMYESALWQVVQENLTTGEHFIVRKDLQQGEARELAERMQKALDHNSAKDSTSINPLQ